MQSVGAELNLLSDLSESESDQVDNLSFSREKSRFQRIRSTIRSRNFLLGLGIGLMTLFLVVSVLGLTIGLTVEIIDCKEPELEVPALQHSLLKHSKEYQIKLDVAQWTDRYKMVRLWNDVLSELSPYINLTGVELKEAVREQYHLDASKCKTKAMFRVRDYLDGGTTVDIKQNAKHNEKKACSYPFWPASSTIGQSSQKCEQDVHKCYTKFSRETRITFEETTEFITCLDFVSLFPWAFGSLDMYHLENKLMLDRPRTPWWIGSLSGYMGDTKFGIEFTLEYSSLSDAIKPTHHPKSGEWSIRIYSRHDGLSDEWNEEIVAETDRVWAEMINKLDNKENPDC